MQSSSTLHSVPPKQNRGGWQFRPGQKRFIDYVAAHPKLPRYVGRLPTGYGKTQIIAASYAALRDAGQGQRLLIIVPTETQEDQYALELERKCRQMSVKVSAVISAEKTERCLKYHRKNQAEIFVATAQRIIYATSGRGDNWLAELLSTGRWIGAADEYHHYSTSNEWGKSIRSLPIEQWIAVSATPARKIGDTIFGAPEPSLVVTYEDAFNEDPRAVKDVSMKVREYSVTVQEADGELTTLKTSELAAEAGPDIDAWETRKQLRYLSKYCSPILLHAVQDLDIVAMDSPERPQMLVYAFSCNHALSLCAVLRSIAPGLVVDWAGVGPNGRPDSQEVLKRFKDQRDESGRITKTHEVDVLVQVNIAGEGLDAIPVCVIVDLSLSGFSPQKVQQYGRGSRAWLGKPLVIYVPADSSIAALAHLKRGIFDHPVDQVAPPAPSDKEPEVQLPLLPDIEVIDAMLIGCMDYEPSMGEVVSVAEAASKTLNVNLDPENNDEHFALVAGWIAGHHRRAQAETSETAKLSHWKDKVGKAVGTLAKELVVAITKGSFEKSLFGDLFKRIHGAWARANARHDAMTVDDFKAKYKWLQETQKRLREGVIPSWAM